MQINVTKLDAARRQLETAILLYFDEADPVAVHTLTAASYNIIRDVNNSRSGSPMLAKDVAPMFVAEPVDNELRRRLNEAENFFKHADRDPDATFVFNPNLTDYFLWDACSTYRNLTTLALPSLLVFQFWFMVNNPEAVRWPDELQSARHEAEGAFRHRDRKRFFSAVFPVATRLFSAGQG